MPMKALAKLALLLLVAAGGATDVLAAAQCNGCGMFLAPYGKSLHRFTLATGERRTFCSFGCLVEAMDKIPPARVKSVEVADFGSGAFVDARTAVYVEGSDAPPVMNHPGLAVFGSAAAAQEYRRSHGGTLVDYQRTLERQRAGGASRAAAAGEEPGASCVALAKPGKKIPLGAGHYFVYSFSKKPAMETIVVKVEVFTNDGRRDTSFVVKGDADMPSMKGAHTLGDQPFKLSKKGDYLLPITFVMPGYWEVSFTFLKDGAVVLRGKYAFDI